EAVTWAVGCTPAAGMGNVLSAEKRQQVIALGRLGWSLRRIEEATGVRRETASTYLRASGVVVRRPGRWGQLPKPAIEVSTDSDAVPAANPANGAGVSTDSAAAPPLPRPGRSPAASACEPYRELIAAALARRRNAMAIWQDLVDGQGFPAGYASVMRFVRQLRGAAAPEAHAVIQTPPGEEGQVDYGDGPMVRHPVTGKYRRTRLFLLTLGYTQRTPLKGLRFERLADAQTYLDHWETRWADTRIHGTTKRQVAAMFAEERPHLRPLPPTPFRYYAFGTRTVHPDGCVEVARAYYRVPPGRIGHDVAVQWD